MSVKEDSGSVSTLVTVRINKSAAVNYVQLKRPQHQDKDFEVCWGWGLVCLRWRRRENIWRAAEGQGGGVGVHLLSASISGLEGTVA